MKELGTGRSRGFGFVSYEERVSAATAVKKMQGYKILGKRLKVEFKKGEGENSMEDGVPQVDADEGGSSKKSYPDDEKLIGYLRAISAKNVVHNLRENERDEEGRDDPLPQDDLPPMDLINDDD
jgi:RNA recognition motif-containing protein